MVDGAQSTGAQQLNLIQQNCAKVRIEPKTVNGVDDLLKRKLVELWTHKVPIAESNIDIATWPTPLIDIEFPTGSKQKFGQFDLTFLVTEKLETYTTLRQWMERNNVFKQNNTTPVALDTSKQRSIAEWCRMAQLDTGQKIKEDLWIPKDYRDIYIQLKDLSNIDFADVVYYEAYPILMPRFEFINSSSENIEVTVSFKYLYMDIIAKDGTSLINC